MQNEVEIIVRGRDSSGPAFDSARNGARRLEREGGSSLGGFAGKIKGMGVAAGAAAALIVVELSKKALTMLIDKTKEAVTNASDLNESVNAVQKIFKTSAKEIEDWGKTSASSFGLSRAEFNKLATPMGALLQGLGFSVKDSADKTLTLTQRAADLASVFNTDVPTAIEAITSALKGETDPIEQYGVHLTAATIQAEALRETHKKSASQLTDNEKATAAYNLIMQQTNASAGDFKDTSDGLANSQRILDAKTKDASASIGEKLLPYMQKLNQIKLHALEYFMREILPKIEAEAKKVAGILRELWDKAFPLIRAELDQLKQKWDENKASIEKLKPFLEALVIVVGGLLFAALFAVLGLVILFVEFLGRVGDTLQQAKEDMDVFVVALLNAFEKILDGAVAAFGWIPGIGPKLKEARDKFHGFAEGVKGAIEGIPEQRIVDVRVRLDRGSLYAARDKIADVLGSTFVNAGLGHKATGGIGGGLTEVGERGRELVRLPQGSMVYPSANTQLMSGAGGGRVEVVLTLDPSGLSDDFDQMIMKKLRTRRILVPSNAITGRT